MKSNNDSVNHNGKAIAITAMSDLDFCEELKEFIEAELNDDERFIWLCSSTMTIYALDPKDNQCSKGRVKRWYDLANIWGRCAEFRDEPNLFILALHKIHWGVHFTEIPANVPIEIVEAVETALLQDGECFKGWKSNDYYRDAFDKVVCQYCPVGRRVPTKRSASYLRYIRNHTWLQVAYKGEIPPMVNLAHYTRAEFISAKKHAAIFAEYHGYELVISKLIPEALGWDKTQWLDEYLLYSKIKKLYGVSMKDFSKELDHIITFLMELWYYRTTSVEKLLSVTSMPDALMKVIWPEKTQREVTKLLCLAYSRVKSAHTYLGKYGRQVYGCTWEKLRESWLYKRCKEWVYNGELIDVAPRTKKIVFEIESSLAT